jgi:PilZ domain-containing protein
MAAEKGAPKAERRNETRMSLRLPVRVQGHDARNQPWAEMATMENTSFGGAAMRMKRPVVRGQVIFLALPLPRHFRSYDLSEAFYRVYALVRHVSPSGGELKVGVMFLGKVPPKDYEANPGGLYLLPTDPPPAAKEERRKWPRTDIFVNVRLHWTSPGGGELQEQTIAENIGRGGARLLTSLPVVKGDVVRLEEVDGDFRVRAEICNIYIGPDHIPRLNLRFLDAAAPDRLLGGS